MQIVTGASSGHMRRRRFAQRHLQQSDGGRPQPAKSEMATTNPQSLDKTIRPVRVSWRRARDAGGPATIDIDLNLLDKTP
jgi:hypothetical protein